MNLHLASNKPHAQFQRPRENFSALHAHDLPTMATLAPNLHGACFTVMKMLSARAIIDDALASGRLKRGGLVVESTSGTFGLALAMLKSYYGYELILVSDPVIDSMLQTRLNDLGARLEIVEAAPGGSYQVARLARVREIMERHPDACFTNQYHNPANARGYARLADYLASQFPRIDCLVGTVGTGGSMCGTAARLREHFPKLKVIGVDTHNSVIFGQPPGARTLRGLGNSLVPSNVHHTQFDEVHWVSAAEAYLATRQLNRERGLFMGGTSGAAYMVARWHATENPRDVTVAIFPDEGYRYLDTIYNDDYLKTLPGWGDTLAEDPHTLYHPRQEARRWSRLHWNRRTLEQVLHGQSRGPVAD